MNARLGLGFAALLALGACGDTVAEQAVVGAGAGAGAAVLLDGDPLLGAAGGAAANVLFCQNNPDQCDSAGLPL